MNTARILALDIAGNPFDWLRPEDAATYYATDKVAWELGEPALTLRGGYSKTGVQSTLAIAPIIALARSERMAKMLRDVIPLGDDNTLLFARDRHTCAYCGDRFPREKLSRDHILAQARGGANSWMNCVTSCRACNNAKGDRLVEDFQPLLYVPYAPCRFEHFILSGRNVLAEQHEYLAAKLPKHSRLH